jgi:NTE family protein
VQAAPIRMHLISGTDTLSTYHLSSKYNTDMAFLTHLHDLGVAAAERWLTQNVDHVGVRSTLDPDPIYHAEEGAAAS